LPVPHCNGTDASNAREQTIIPLSSKKSDGFRFAVPILHGAQRRSWVALRPISARSGVLLLALATFHLATSTFAYAGQIPNDPTSRDSLVQIEYQPEKSIKVFLGAKKIPFCIGAEYVNDVTQLSDGSNRVDMTMFLPDLSPEDVYDKLHPIPRSPEFWSPQRLAFKHSILDINVSASYRGPSDPTGQIALIQLLDNNKEFAVLSSKYPVPGFTEYDDKWGNPSVYFYKGDSPYGITCFGYACTIFVIFNNALYFEISLDKTSLPSTPGIIKGLYQLMISTKCSD
jgi:hypothetical protein